VIFLKLYFLDNFEECQFDLEDLEKTLRSEIEKLENDKELLQQEVEAKTQAIKAYQAMAPKQNSIFQKKVKK